MTYEKSRIQIRIQLCLSEVGYGSADPVPYQNVTDPELLLRYRIE
jgi:hypothetical protein